MPIETPTERSTPVFFPTEDYTIVKYLDITKFISMLYKKALFFCRLDKLEDQFEGTTAIANYESRIKFRQHLRDTGFYTIPISDEKIIQDVKLSYQTEKRFKQIFCVNCWNKKETESAALWKIYSDFSKGIMIKSSVSNLKKSLINSSQELFLSEIRYLDYESQIMPDGNLFYPVIHKQSAYSYEEEIRLIHFIETESGYKHDWTKEELEDGIYIDVNLDQLIDEIVLSPFSPQWFFDLITDISVKYGLQKKINKSKLSLV